MSGAYLDDKVTLARATHGRCVFCDSFNMSFDNTTFDLGVVSQEADCSDCGKTHWVAYEIKYVETQDDQQ